MKTNKKGIDLIKEFEGCKLQAYNDSVGICTIGYGHTKTAKRGQTITQEQAEELLKQDLEYFEDCVNNLVKVEINQNMFDALVSFTYNLGEGSLKKSTLLRLLNKGEYDLAANEFKKWRFAGGKELKGLARRREAEKQLFLLIPEEINKPKFKLSHLNKWLFSR